MIPRVEFNKWVRILALGGVLFLLLVALILLFVRSQSASAVSRLQSDVFAEVIVITNLEAEENQLHLVFPRGAAHNTYVEGLAHYVEHLAWFNAFRGHESERADAARHSNASVNHWTTHYWVTVKNEAEFAANLERLTKVATPLDLDEAFVLSERNIVLSEHDYRSNPTPLGKEIRELHQTVMNNGPNTRSLLGKRTDIAAFSYADAEALHEDSHRLNEATLLVYGNRASSEVEAVLTKLALPEAPSASPPELEFDFRTDGPIDVRRREIEGLKSPYILDVRVVEVRPCNGAFRCTIRSAFLEDALTGGSEDSLYVAVVYGQPMADTLALSVDFLDDEHVQIWLEARPNVGVAAEDLLHTADKHLDRLLRQGLSKRTFEKVQNEALRDIDINIDHIDDEIEEAYKQILDGLLSSTIPIGHRDRRRIVGNLKNSDITALLFQLEAGGARYTRFLEPMK